MTFKEISEKYPKAFEEFEKWHTENTGFGIATSLDIRKYYSDIVDFFETKRMIISFLYWDREDYRFMIDIYSNVAFDKNKQIKKQGYNSRPESETAGLEQLFKIYEERIGK